MMALDGKLKDQSQSDSMSGNVNVWTKFRANPKSYFIISGLKRDNVKQF